MHFTQNKQQVLIDKPTLKLKCYHFDEIFIPGWNEGQKFHQNDSVSVTDDYLWNTYIHTYIKVVMLKPMEINFPNEYVFCICCKYVYIIMFNSLRPSDAYMRQ